MYELHRYNIGWVIKFWDSKQQLLYVALNTLDENVRFQPMDELFDELVSEAS